MSTDINPNDGFRHRFRAKSQAGSLARHIFRVVATDPQDMILWSEWDGGGDGMTWRGPLKLFKSIFEPYKEPAT